MDLRCWMALSSKVLRQLAEQVGDSQWVPTVEEDVRLYNNVEDMDKLHWSEQTQQYADYGLHSEHVQLIQVWPLWANIVKLLKNLKNVNYTI